MQVTGKEDKMVALKEVLEPYGEAGWASFGSWGSFPLPSPGG